MQKTLEPVTLSTNLRNAKLEGARMTGANLHSADLSGANLSKAIMNSADLSQATMKDTILDEADLEGAILIDVADLTCPRLTVAINWKKSFRSQDLHCGSDNPPENGDNQ